MKKKLLSIVAVAMSCFMLAGCANNGSSNENSSSAQTSEESTTEKQTEEETTTNQTTGETTAVNIAALKGPTSMGMVKLMNDSDNGNTSSNDYTFTIAGAVDEITPKVVQGQVDIAAIPANLASVLYNNTGGEVDVLAINTLGVLYIVENGDSIQSVEDLRGKTIYSSGKGATPEYALNYMLKANGIDPETDVTIEYKSEHSECVAALASSENTIAMLPQPFVTTAQLQNENIRIALDLTKEWENASSTEGTDATLITGVVVARKAFIEENPEAVATFMEQYKESIDYVNANVDAAADLIGSYDIVKAEVAKKALPYCNITYIDGEEMQQKLSGYLSILFEQEPASVGGNLPNEDFYYTK